MKEIIRTNLDKDIIEFNNFEFISKKIYISVNSNGELSKLSYYKEAFWRPLHKVDGGYFVCAAGDSKASLKKMLDEPNCEHIYVFDTLREFSEWLYKYTEEN